VKRLRELAARLELPAAAPERLDRLLELLSDDPHAPTSVTERDQALDVHVADSLAALPLLRAHEALDALVDIGSGAGFPGLPLAIALPGTQVDLVESTGRKCRFLERAIVDLGLERTRVVCMRAEDWARAEGAGRYDAATVRAVGPLPTLVEYASPLLSEGGILVAWKGARDSAEEDAGHAAAAALGLAPRGVMHTEPFPAARDHHLHVFEKTAPTPPGYPRKPGAARKRPLRR